MPETLRELSGRLAFSFEGLIQATDELAARYRTEAQAAPGALAAPGQPGGPFPPSPLAAGPGGTLDVDLGAGTLFGRGASQALGTGVGGFAAGALGPLAPYLAVGGILASGYGDDLIRAAGKAGGEVAGKILELAPEIGIAIGEAVIEGVSRSIGSEGGKDLILDALVPGRVSREAEQNFGVGTPRGLLQRLHDFIVPPAGSQTLPDDFPIDYRDDANEILEMIHSGKYNEKVLEIRRDFWSSIILESALELGVPDDETDRILQGMDLPGGRRRFNVPGSFSEIGTLRHPPPLSIAGITGEDISNLYGRGRSFLSGIGTSGVSYFDRFQVNDSDLLEQEGTKIMGMLEDAIRDLNTTISGGINLPSVHGPVESGAGQIARGIHRFSPGTLAGAYGFFRRAGQAGEEFAGIGDDSAVGRLYGRLGRSLESDVAGGVDIAEQGQALTIEGINALDFMDRLEEKTLIAIQRIEGLDAGLASVGQSGGDALRGLLKGTTGWGDALGHVATRIQDVILELALIKPFESLFAKLIGGAVGSIITGSDTTERAYGGPVMAGESYIVGERGVEVFTPSMSGHITPNHELSSGMGRGDAPITVNMEINDADPARARAYMDASLARAHEERIRGRLHASSDDYRGRG